MLRAVPTRQLPSSVAPGGSYRDLPVEARSPRPGRSLLAVLASCGPPAAGFVFLFHRGFSQSLISRRIFPSAIRRATHFSRPRCGIVSKYCERCRGCPRASGWRRPGASAARTRRGRCRLGEGRRLRSSANLTGDKSGQDARASSQDEASPGSHGRPGGPCDALLVF